MEEKSANRVARWTQRLLDLSLRNRLLNAKDSKQIIPLVAESIGELEDRLADDQAVSVEGSDVARGTKGALRSTLASADLQKRLKEVYRLARTDLEESGVNALYLAIGFLVWRPQGANAKEYRAPILLMPVGMTRKNVREGYAVSALDEDELLNATLVEFLRAEFGLSVEGVDPLPEDASGVDVAKVLAAFREATRSMEGWRVEESAALGNFSFGKFVMWKDLSARAEQLAAHPFVSHLMRGGGAYDDGIEVFPPEEVAGQIRYGELYAPLSADSSQLTAVLYSAMGKSFVLHGPPGTGKSQTITNLIAHNLALGRKVLFVSEKKAALDVVHRRLSSIGLKPFCLELHSNKAGKGEVLAQFKEALDFADKGVPNEWAKTVDQIAKCREALNAAVAALHKRQPNGLTAYDCFAARIASDVPSFPLCVEKISDWGEQDVAQARELAVHAAADWRETKPEAFKALAMVETFSWNPAAEADVREKLTALAKKGKIARGLSVLFSGKGLLTRYMRFKTRFAGFADDYPARLQAAIDALGESRTVMRYRASEFWASNLIGTGLAEALEEGKLDPQLAGAAFDRSVAETTLNEILRKESALASFSGLAREEQILEFRRLDAEYAELVRHFVRATLASKMPRGRLGDCPDGCELGVIRRECAKKARQKPVRQLLAETRGVTGALKPCFLMSPLSVAQYLPAEASFDLVVFDEASQIPVWEAIGALARARQCVIVGDPKQMPPTNFFQKAEAGEDEEESEDLESILDECLAAGLHSAHLNWHYRSRHESLIAFSNHNYYEDRLCTFPAARSPATMGVRFHYVEDGVYEAKASRTNRKEAEALVDYIFACLAEPGRKRRSAGVVTFSMAQKDLIEDLLEERRAANPQYEDYFTTDGEEPFFVKNLENVQGDERDVILFSVGYAKGPDGKFLMNFGPLNRAGGERRLNVAVTRAKEQVVVFASCKGAEIDLNRTQAVGAAHLKAFLEYAERGGIATTGAVESSVRDRFADVVADFLRGKGYEVERRVGCSGYRIDLGVRSPERREAFLAAIECDGDSYASANTARDRDELRASVLGSLGWNTLRVWSADWAFDRARAEDRLMKALDEIRRAPDGRLPAVKFTPEVTFPRRHPVVETEPAKMPLEQVSNDQLRAMMEIVEKDLGRCETDTLYRETVRRFGYKTLSPKARERLQSVRRF